MCWCMCVSVGVMKSIEKLMSDFDSVDNNATSTVTIAATVKPIYKSAHVFFTEGLSTTNPLPPTVAIWVQV